MTIHEPATLLTDYLLAALAGWLGWQLSQRTKTDNPAARWWSRALWLTAASAFVGGSYHGFGSGLPFAFSHALWVVTLLIISFTSAAMALTLVHELVQAERHRLWLSVVGLKFGLFATIAVARPVFIVAIVDYGLTMVAWFIAALACRRPWRGWMLAAITLSVIAATVQQVRWGLSSHFNHNDVYHAIQAVAIYLFYRAAQHLGHAQSDIVRFSADGTDES